MGDQRQFAGSSGDDGGSIGQILGNPTQKTNKIKIETGIDWISELPDSLLVQILSLLPTLDAFRTSFLSKRWQYLWTSIDTLIFNTMKMLRPDSLDFNEYISFTDNVLRLHSCSNIKKFSLTFIASDGVSYSSKIDKWLEIALKKNVEEVALQVWHIRAQQPYSLPQVLCSSSSILELKCNHCRIPEDFVIKMTSLKSLTLEYMFLRDEHIEQIVSNCPQLESLKLIDFSGFHRLRLTSPKCIRLELIDPEEYWLASHMDGGYFEIIAPYVQHLKISGLFDGVEIKLGELPSLVCADLTFRSYGSLRRPDENDMTIVINDLLVSLRCANELTIPSWLTEVISMLMWEKEDASLPLLECKWLTINSWITEFSFLGITSLLRSAPYAENMRILFEFEYKGVKLIINYWDDEEINLWRKKYLLSLQQNLFKGSLQNLKNVTVISDCFHFIRRGGREVLPRFLKFLLEHAINLEKLVIMPEHRCHSCSAYMSEMMENFLAVPRASLIVQFFPRASLIENFLASI